MKNKTKTAVVGISEMICTLYFLPIVFNQLRKHEGGEKTKTGKKWKQLKTLFSLNVSIKILSSWEYLRWFFTLYFLPIVFNQYRKHEGEKNNPGKKGKQLQDPFFTECFSQYKQNCSYWNIWEDFLHYISYQLFSISYVNMEVPSDTVRCVNTITGTVVLGWVEHLKPLSSALKWFSRI